MEGNQGSMNGDGEGLKKGFYVFLILFRNGKTEVYVLDFQPQSLEKGKISLKAAYFLCRKTYDLI
jgi:hypothetical protein